MPIITGSRLENLRRLRTRIDMEIQVLEDGERLMAKRQAKEDRATKRQRAASERARERRQARRDLAAAHQEEVAAVELAAPAGLVRAWARQQGIEVGSHGRLSLDLRKQYLAAQEVAS